jgi:hypothetical protein
MTRQMTRTRGSRVRLFLKMDIRFKWLASFFSDSVPPLQQILYYQYRYELVWKRRGHNIDFRCCISTIGRVARGAATHIFKFPLARSNTTLLESKNYRVDPSNKHVHVISKIEKLQQKFFHLSTIITAINHLQLMLGGSDSFCSTRSDTGRSSLGILNAIS